MSTSTITQVPMFNGSNYPTWEVSMKAYLCLQGVWQIVSGENKQLADTYTETTCTVGTGENAQSQTFTTNTTSDEQHKEQTEWDQYDDMAQGAIQMHLPTDISLTVMKETSEKTWDCIAKTYGRPGAAGKFAIFCEAITFTISDNVDLTGPIFSLMSLFSCLAGVEVTFSDPIKAMIILAALLISWDLFCATMLVQSNDISPTDIIPSIADEYHQ
ncbi:hypothetical protein GYMLUDRAFT_249310 [Collybiopsis luxurians FD-317 M1]|uniref:DUF4219 domain-containing protein n=1 Tax=Collybiopsis luxurians FD-317 M1 TaxID=944289 RepID=A0A0D0BXP6_9AGAR|nr:hypothetical protein GYMLUDRAFT_249310 [Collybiopsis luxurians FD-317 M1]